jgi:hypothetical protein
LAPYQAHAAIAFNVSARALSMLHCKKFSARLLDLASGSVPLQSEFSNAAGLFAQRSGTVCFNSWTVAPVLASVRAANSVWIGSRQPADCSGYSPIVCALGIKNEVSGFCFGGRRVVCARDASLHRALAFCASSCGPQTAHLGRRSRWRLGTSRASCARYGTRDYELCNATPDIGRAHLLDEGDRGRRVMCSST